jgi:outer membrane protein TolC
MSCSTPEKQEFFHMKRISVIPLFTLFVFIAGAASAFAQANWVNEFLNRYRPIAVTFPANSPASQQDLANMIRSGQLPLSASDMINLVLSNNLDVSLNRLSPLSAQYALLSSRKPFEPTLNLSALVSKNTTASPTIFGGAVALDQLNHSYIASFAQSLQTGTNLGVSFTLNRASTNSTFTTFDPYWTTNITYSVVQHLARNFGRNVNSRPIRIAQNNKQISDIQFEQEVINLVVQAQKAYWDLVFNTEDIKVKQRSMDLAQKTLSDNQVQVNIGTMAPIDLVQAESEVATRQEALIVSTYTQTQGEDQAKKLITAQADPGMVLAHLVAVEPVKRPQPNDVPPVEEAIRIALENRPEMRQLELDLKNKQIDVDYTKNQLLPSIDLTGSFTQTGLGGPQSIRQGFGGPVVQVVPGGVGDAFGQLFGSCIGGFPTCNFTGYSVGLNIQIPLSNRSAQADNARALTEKKISGNRLNSTAQQIALDVRNALTQVEMNRARIDAAQKAKELAERRLQSEQKKFDLGASTIRFVLEEQRNVTQAQTDEISALVNYTKALVDLDRATGMTLKKNNIQLDKDNKGVAAN